jgi:hypothetical protein
MHIHLQVNHFSNIFDDQILARNDVHKFTNIGGVFVFYKKHNHIRQVVTIKKFPAGEPLPKSATVSVPLVLAS